MNRYIAITLLASLLSSFTVQRESIHAQKADKLIGAWETQSGENTGLWIFSDKHFSISYYSANGFDYTEGGMWTLTDGKIQLTWEYHTKNTDKVGTSSGVAMKYKDNEFSIDKTSWKRVDNGTPGQLAGAWLITGRYRDGELSERTPGVRRTMKILSGTKFQWIAYNIETKEFFGTGGGSYTTKDGKYTESIEFFSRDNSRVGASLEFDFKLENGKWRHSGKSSKGEPLDEVWTKREVLGI